jgi:hypothetical protein
MSNQHMRRRGADPMMGVSEFLLARIVEDEDEAVGAAMGRDHDPADPGLVRRANRVLAEGVAKRQIIRACDSLYAEEVRSSMADADLILAALAGVYAGHPDYQRSWRP